jgi:hypothetical protein
MTKLIYLPFFLLILVTLVGCNAQIDIKQLNDTTETAPVPEPEPRPEPAPELDIIAVRDSMFKGEGENSSTQMEPLACGFEGTVSLFKLLNLSSKIAFGIAATPAFSCGECTLLVKCIPGELVNMKSYDAGDNLLYDEDYACGVDGEIPFTEKYGLEFMKVQAMMNGKTETEYLNCEYPVR